MGNEELPAKAIANLKKNGMKVHLAGKPDEILKIIRENYGFETKPHWIKISSTLATW